MDFIARVRLIVDVPVSGDVPELGDDNHDKVSKARTAIAKDAEKLVAQLAKDATKDGVGGYGAKVIDALIEEVREA